jgi:SNF2 family DNA or RNA helicase
MTITLDVVDGQIVITGSIEFDRDVVKTISGVRASGSKRWTLPFAIPTFLEAQYAVKRDGGRLTDIAHEWARDVVGFAQNATYVLKEKQWPAAALGEYTLRPDQETDAQFLFAMGNGFCLHPPRLGKTLVALRVMDLHDKWPVLFVVKPRTILGIKRQVEKAFPNRTVATLTSKMTATQRKKELAKNADIVLVGHNLLELHSRILPYGGTKQGKNGAPSERDRERAKGLFEPKELNDRHFPVVIVDEAHRAKSPRAHVTRALWALGDAAEHRYQLTGTPAPNSEDEWWASLRFCYPKFFPSRSTWVNRYIEMKMNTFGIPKCRGWMPETKELWQRIFALCHVRRENLDEARQEIRVIPVELSKQQEKLYKDLATHSMGEVNGELVIATDTMSLRHRLQNVANATPSVDGSGSVTALGGTSAKVEALLEYLEESEDKTIVVCESRLFADYVIGELREAKYNVVSILGGMTVEQSQASEDAFQTDPAVQVIVINAAGVEGTELSAARRLVFMEVSEDYTFMEQAVRRNLSQAQQHDVVEVAYLYAVGTLEEAKYESYERKDTKLHENLNDANWIRRNIFGSQQ